MKQNYQNVSVLEELIGKALILKIIISNETKLSKCVRFGRTDIMQTILYKISY
jgi:hypothetical protein